MIRKRFVLAAAIVTLLTTAAVAVGTQRSTSKPQPLSGGASGVIELQNCGRVGFVAAPINQSLTCPADRPIPQWDGLRRADAVGFNNRRRRGQLRRC